jgi:hypothetical protein
MIIHPNQAAFGDIFQNTIDLPIIEQTRKTR